MREIKYLVVHCTASPQITSIESIKNHWKSLGWKNVGYHKVIKANGEIITLAPDDQPTNGVKGYNSVSLHVSYIGGIDSRLKAIDNRTKGQKDCLLMVLNEWKQKYPNAQILGHRDFPGVAKECPSFDAKSEYANL